jgi:hypothetical protein
MRYGKGKGHVGPWWEQRRASEAAAATTPQIRRRISFYLFGQKTQASFFS